MKNRTLTYFRNRLELMEHANYYSPFPLYCTEYVKEVKGMIEQMENNKKDYDNIPVVACKYCNSLYIINDDLENDICGNCHSMNEIIIFDNIDEYLEYKDEE